MEEEENLFLGGSSAGRPQPGELVGHSCLAGSRFGLGHFTRRKGKAGIAC